MLRPDQPFMARVDSTAKWVQVYNRATEDIPPHGIMRIVGTDADDYLVVDKPDTNGMTSPLLFNDDKPIRALDYGIAMEAIFPLTAAYDVSESETGTDPVADEIWGVKADSWYLNRHYPGFVILETGLNRTVNVRLMQFAFVHALRRLSSDRNALGYYPARLVYLIPRTGEVIDSGIDVWEKDLNG